MNKFLTGIIVVLVAIIFLQRGCTGPVTEQPKPGVEIDTVYLTKDTTIYKKVTLVKRDTVRQPGDIVYIPDTNYKALKLQYLTLAKDHAARNIYRDTIQLDSIGMVVVHDTVQYNALRKHRFDLSYKIPVITKTVTLQPEPRRQVYIGGGISMNTALEEANFQVGMLYKNKKDQVFGVYSLLDGNSIPQFGVSSYWKIKLKK